MPVQKLGIGSVLIQLSIPPDTLVIRQQQPGSEIDPEI